MQIHVMFVVDVPPKHRAGDVRSVSGGYARNYLFPKGYAVPATVQHLRRIEKVKETGDQQRAKEIRGLQGLSEALDGLVVTVAARAGQQGRLFGSITALTIAKAVFDSTGHEIDRKSVELESPIKELGSFDVKIRLHHEVIPSLTVVVTPEGYAADDQEMVDQSPIDEVPLAGDDTIIENFSTEETSSPVDGPSSNLEEGIQDVRGEDSPA